MDDNDGWNEGERAKRVEARETESSEERIAEELAASGDWTNRAVECEYRICPAALTPKDRSGIHTAFRQPGEGWFSCIRNGSWQIMPSGDHGASPIHPWGDALANVYREYCTYFGNEQVGFRRRRDRIVAVNGVFLDFDCHSCKDMRLDSIREILLCDDFAKAVPWNRIVSTGHGFHLHFPLYLEIILPGQTDRAHRLERVARLEGFIRAVANRLATEWKLRPDPGCLNVNRGWRVPGTWNTKDVLAPDNLAARIPVEVVVERDFAQGHANSFFHESIQMHPTDAGAGHTPAKADEKEDAVREMLDFIPPGRLHYTDWLRVGMALHHWDPERGLHVWDGWSRSDADRYDHHGIDYRWNTFGPHSNPVTLGTVRRLAAEHGWQPAGGKGEKTTVLLPGNGVRILDSGRRLGRLLAESGQFFRKGRIPVRVSTDASGNRMLREVEPREACSLFEAVASLQRLDPKGERRIVVAGGDDAARIMASHTFLGQLGPIRVITDCPILVRRPDGSVAEITGYDSDSGVFSWGTPTEVVSLNAATALIREAVADFDFITPNDRARAIAGIISPALVFGGHIRGRAPVDVTEADESQAGKGYRNRLTAAFYGAIPSVVNSRTRGVGGLEESFDTALMRGRPFISLDNLRGSVSSQKLESFMTEDTYGARVPHRAEAEVDPSKYIIMLTSNRAEMTPDLARRCSIVNIRRRPDGYSFHGYPEGDILSRVRAARPLYLGAVHAVVGEWIRRGSLRADVRTGTAFSDWFAVTEWIITVLLGEVSPSTGHAAAQRRVSDPMMQFLRELALGVRERGRLGTVMTTSEILDIIAEDLVRMPWTEKHTDFSSEEDRRTVLQTLGRRLKPMFGSSDGVCLGEFTVERRVSPDAMKGRDVTTYLFKEIGGNP